jgi:hypothetical protein
MRAAAWDRSKKSGRMSRSMEVSGACYSGDFGRTTFLDPAMGEFSGPFFPLGGFYGRPPYIGGEQLTSPNRLLEVNGRPLARSRFLLTPLSAFRDSNFPTLGLTARASARAFSGHEARVTSPDTVF